MKTLNNLVYFFFGIIYSVIHTIEQKKNKFFEYIKQYTPNTRDVTQNCFKKNSFLVIFHFLWPREK